MIPVPALPLALPLPAAAVRLGTASRPTATARPVRIPAPRPPSDRAAHPVAGPAIRIPSPRVPTDSARPTAAGRPASAGKHRAAVVATSRSQTALRLAGRVGSLTTLAAMLVLSAAVTGLLDGVAPTGPAAQVATTTLR